MSTHPLEDILHPNSIAIAGASNSGPGGKFLASLLELGFKGKIYPINPEHMEIQGLKCYPSLRDIPEPVDYLISSVPASQVLNLIDDCAINGVKSIHFFTARFSETGRKDAIELEKEILRKAKNARIRVIGPNCLGIYYPAWGMGWNTGMPKEAGVMGLISQSGGAASDLIEGSRTRGLHFSKGISYGNAIDFNECDLLEYFAQDNETKFILIYIEGVRDGKRFLDTLRKTTLKKPVIMLKGGRGESGTRATASHTASLAGSTQIWKTAMKQAGAIDAVDIEELLDIASIFYFSPPVFGKRVGIAGGSGGGSVMAADLCEEAGLNVIPMPDVIREELKRQGNPVWDWISNPVDYSISTEEFNIGDLIGMMAAHPDFDLNIIFVAPPTLARLITKHPPKTVDEQLKKYPLDKLNGKPMLVVLYDRNRNFNDRSGDTFRALFEMREKLAQRHLPVFSNVGRAANAVVKVIDYYKTQKERNAN